MAAGRIAGPAMIEPLGKILRTPEALLRLVKVVSFPLTNAADRNSEYPMTPVSRGKTLMRAGL